MKLNRKIGKLACFCVLAAFPCFFGSSLYASGEEQKTPEKPHTIDKETLSNPKALLSYKPGYYNLEKDKNGKITSVILIVENDSKRIKSGGEARLAAMGILAELINPPTITVETTKSSDGKETRVVKTSTTTTIVGYSFNLIAQGMDVQRKKQISVFRCDKNISQKQ